MRPTALALALLWGVLGVHGDRFNIRCNNNLVMYWGQNSHAIGNPGENQLPLDEYCDKNSADVLVLSFLSEFNADNLHPPTLNFANSCVTPFENSTLLHCSNLGKAISKCQKQGKIVLLSLGGASGAYGFSDDIQAERYADKIWDMFLGGEARNRPFDGAILDGIDLDIEGGSSVGYVRFVQRLRERFTEATGRRFYVSTAPQCPYPDFYSGPILDNAYLDMVFVQFYNNYCGVDNPNWFNFEQWHEWATTISANKDVRVYLGVPGSRAAASTGHLPPAKLKELVNATRSKFDSFGGMMVWDISQAEHNQVAEGSTFVDIARQLLDSGKKCTDGSDSADDGATDASVSSHTPPPPPPHKGGSGQPTASRHSTGSASAAAAHDEPAAKATGAEEPQSSSGDDGASTEVSEVEAGSAGGGHFAAENLNRVAVGSSQDSSASESSAAEDTAAGDESAQSESESDTVLRAESEDATSSEESSDGASEPAADEGSGGEPDEQTTDGERTAEDGQKSTDDTAPADEQKTTEDTATADEQKTAEDTATESEAEAGNDTTTVQSTKVLHTTTTRTRKVHIVTRHVTKHVRKSTDIDFGSLTAPSPASTNKSISIVTPTFPLPIARCPRADQPCIGAGFACNGYEFGQCVNNRWLMRPCSTDRITACFNAGPDLIACDFPKGRSLQVCDDILAPLPYGRLASNVLFLRGSDQERALNTPVYPAPTPTPTTTYVKKKKKDDDDDDDEDTDDDDDDYIYNKYGEKKKNTSMTSVTDMELVKQSSGVNLIDDHNRREDPAMLMVKDPAAYYGPDGHVRVVGGNVVDDLRKHNNFGTTNEPYDENPPVDDPEEADEYSEGDEFMRKRDLGAWDEEDAATSSVLAAPSPARSLAVRSVKDLVGESASAAHLNEKPWRAQVEDFYSIYALYSALSGITNDMEHQQFERAILDHIDGDFLVGPHLPALTGRPLLAHFTFVPVRGSDPDYMHYRTKDGMVEQDVLVVVRMLTNIPIPKRWRVALPLPMGATMLHTSRGTFYSGDRVSAEVKSIYVQRVAFYNENIRIVPARGQGGQEVQQLNDLAAGHSTNRTEGAADHEFDDGPSYDSIRRSLISPAVISQILRKKPAAPPPPELLDEPVANDPAGHLYEVRSNPEVERPANMALRFTIRIKTRPTPDGHVVGALPHPILSFITTY
ncbi:Chitinase 2 [Coemansia javaensis]|uniref:chitinase n=1 Tax=Coemansia javaensis TaxID=2761396 RepID=A0A9W8H7N9_9FUNG|nr:Chitinase 2 [Coemansia javaensis]